MAKLLRQDLDRIVGRRDRATEPEHHFRLDPRLLQVGNHDGCGILGDELQGAIPHERPHRGIDVVAVPDGAIGETDLATDWLPTLGPAHACDLMKHLVGVVELETRGPRTHRLDRLATGVRLEQRRSNRADLGR